MPGASLMMRFFESPPRESRSASGLAPRPTTNKAAEKIPVPFEPLGDREFAGRQTDPRGNGQKHCLARGPVTSRRSDRASGQGRPFEHRRRRAATRLWPGAKSVSVAS